MSCKTMQKQISLAIDGRLDLLGRQELDAHLEGCPDCRNWREEQIVLEGWLSRPVSTTLSPYFAHHLHQRIEDLTTQRRVPFFAFPRLRTLALQSIMVALFLVALTIGLSLGSNPLPSTDENGEAVFNRTLNLDLFTDQPAESFGAAYTSLLLGERL